MAGWHHDNANWQPRFCVVCGSEFKPSSGIHKFCSEYCKGKWQYISGRLSTENQYKSISGNWRRYYARLVGRSKDRGHLTVENLLELHKQQEGLCALSGVEMTCLLEKGTRCWTNASIDRIEAGGPYVLSNIRLTCFYANMIRLNNTDKELLWWVNKIKDRLENG